DDEAEWAVALARGRGVWKSATGIRGLQAQRDACASERGVVRGRRRPLRSGRAPAAARDEQFRRPAHEAKRRARAVRDGALRAVPVTNDDQPVAAGADEEPSRCG